MKNIFTLFAALIASVILPSMVLAQDHVLVNPLTESGGNIPITLLIGQIVRALLAIAGSLAVAFLVLAGLQLIVGFTQGNTDRIESGKRTLFYAIMGVIVAFGGFIIINAIIQQTSFLIGA